ncbi:cyclic-di-AMP receptor [Alicyclobacillus pomorum]
MKQGGVLPVKMIIAVVQDKDSPRLAQNLVKEGIRATKMASTGGFLHAGNTTFMIGTTEDKVPQVLDLIQSSCRSREQVVTPMSPMGSQLESYVPYPVSVQVGGATVFVIDVEQFEQF